MEIPFSILSATSDRTSSPVAEIKAQIDSLLELLAQQEEDLRLARLMLHRANTEVTLYGKAPHRTTRPHWAMPLKRTFLWLWP